MTKIPATLAKNISMMGFASISFHVHSCCKILPQPIERAQIAILVGFILEIMWYCNSVDLDARRDTKRSPTADIVCTAEYFAFDPRLEPRWRARSRAFVTKVPSAACSLCQLHEDWALWVINRRCLSVVRRQGLSVKVLWLRRNVATPSTSSTKE
ncbi:hypothetical protein EJ03DRAFT_327958 [Teratosphaeria nubilosa]|uniref:Uncharacterized protein n=1 Tax=Teratosphaeria nubilosa TaxID=161662 RepID=A0A6G1L7K4_9PEZI|nr:hypothetical protein EJ03DRAFT_327958 [Teratosphaeria nubilosa]